MEGGFYGVRKADVYLPLTSGTFVTSFIVNSYKTVHCAFEAQWNHIDRSDRNHVAEMFYLSFPPHSCVAP